MSGALSDLTRRAREAWPVVAGLPLDERLERARAARAALAAAAPAIVDEAVHEVGQPRRFARREVESALGLLDALPALAEAIRPREVSSVSGRTELQWAPYGVVFGWHAANSPVWVPTLVTQSALVAGNAVLSRPSSRARRTTGRVLDALAPAWPEDAIVAVEQPAPEAQQLVAHPEVDAVVAHSSTETCKRHLAALGEAYAAGAPLRPYIPEASGNDALLVLPGADLEQAAAAAAIAAFANGGQLCMSAKRIVVERSVLERFVPLLVDRVAELVVGDPDDERTDVASIAEGPARRRAREALREALAAGGRILVGSGERDGIFTPTIVRLPRTALEVALWRQESFAPLRSLVVAESSVDAVALANDSSFGLGAAIFGGDDAVVATVRGARVVVDTSPLYQDAHLVVGGVKDSGIAGARPKLEQLVFARRVHREAPGGA
jgi:acyl-CoA reductase-like NAD-dependent aldehyde dehydrogenase